ncbi:hypothetical protein ACQJBY_002751 [Aegilops geniculata]
MPEASLIDISLPSASSSSDPSHHWEDSIWDRSVNVPGAQEYGCREAEGLHTNSRYYYVGGDEKAVQDASLEAPFQQMRRREASIFPCPPPSSRGYPRCLLCPAKARIWLWLPLVFLLREGTGRG